MGDLIIIHKEKVAFLKCKIYLLLINHFNQLVEVLSGDRGLVAVYAREVCPPTR